MNRIQKIQFDKLLEYLKIENNYYNKIIKGTSCSIEDFPILRKQDILDNILDYISRPAIQDIGIKKIEKAFSNLIDLSSNHDYIIDGKKQKWCFEYTTGSSGKPFPVLKSQITKICESKSLMHKRRRIFSDAAINNGFLFLHTNSRFIRENNIWEFNEADMRQVVEIWKSSNVKWIFATPLILYKYGEYMKRNGYSTVLSKKLSFVEYTSQKIDRDYENVISEVFGTNIISNYGTREVWNIAYQCRNGQLHLEDKNLIVELVDDNGMVITEYGKIGYVVITSLINKEMPLIRYYIGDRASLKKSDCACGCNSDILHLENSREIFKIKGSNYYGNEVFRRVMRGIYFHDKFKGLKNIRIVQDELNHFNIYVQGNPEYADDIRKSFIRRTISIAPELSRFRYDFIFDYKMENDGYRFKEEIYKSII